MFSNPTLPPVLCFSRVLGNRVGNSHSLFPLPTLPSYATGPRTRRSLQKWFRTKSNVIYVYSASPECQLVERDYLLKSCCTARLYCTLLQELWWLQPVSNCHSVTPATKEGDRKKCLRPRNWKWDLADIFIPNSEPGSLRDPWQHTHLVCSTPSASEESNEWCFFTSVSVIYIIRWKWPSAKLQPLTFPTE